MAASGIGFMDGLTAAVPVQGERGAAECGEWIADDGVVG